MLKFLSFTPLTESCFKRSIQIFAVCIFAVGGVAYCYQLNEAIQFSLSFPSGSLLEGPVWMLHVSLRFLSLWMPFIFIITKFLARNKTILSIYVVGCVIAIALSVTGTTLITEYLQAGYLRKEYERLVEHSIEKGSKLPSQLFHTVKQQECCGWKGAIDFGVTFNITDKVHGDYNFMKKLEECYGHTWTVHKSQGSLVYNAGPKSSEQTPKGCNIFYKEIVRRNCFIIFYCGLLVDIIGVVCVVLCAALYTVSNVSNVVDPDPSTTASQHSYTEDQTTIRFPQPEFVTTTNEATDVQINSMAQYDPNIMLS